MTATEFRNLHGDPTTWTPADIETQQNLAACDALPDFTLEMQIPDNAKASASRLLAPAA